jgi:hypothetical protein
VPAEDQREQVALFVRQRRKRVDHLLDPGIHVVMIVTARATTSAALTWACWWRRGVAVIGAT